MLKKLAIVSVLPFVLTGCATTTSSEKEGLVEINWNINGLKKNYAGVRIVKINGEPISRFTYSKKLKPGKHNVEYICTNLHNFSDLISSTPGRRHATNAGYKMSLDKIDYGYGKTVIDVVQGESVVFQSQYDSLVNRVHPEGSNYGLFTGPCKLVKTGKVGFMDTFMGNLKSLK